MALDTCNDIENGAFADKERFQNFIKAFKILPFKDKYILTNSVYYEYMPNYLISLFDSNDNLQAFKFELCLRKASGNSSSAYDSLYLEDWNRDGNLELLVRREGYSEHKSRFTSFTIIEIFDFTNKENEISKIFEYAPMRTYHSERAEEGEHLGIGMTHPDVITFERPDLIKRVTKWKYTPSVATPVGGTEMILNDEQKETVRKWEARDIETVYYQQDKITKIYKEVKK